MAGCSYPTIKMIADDMKDVQCDTTDEDSGALAFSLLFTRLNLYAVNWKDFPAKHRALYIWMSMIFFTSMGGVNIIPRRNVASESIAKFFMVLRSDVFKPWLLTSEPAEHGFFNMRQVHHEFTCLVLVCLI